MTGRDVAHDDERDVVAAAAVVHGILFQRIQDLTLAGRPDDGIAATVAAEASRAFGMLEGALGDDPGA